MLRAPLALAFAPDERRLNLRARPAFVVALAVAAGLALALPGCASSPSAKTGAPGANATTPGAGPGAPGRGALVAAAFPNVKSSDQTLSFNGTLTPDKANTGPGMPLSARPQSDSVLTFDVTKILPKNVPAIIVGDLKTQMSQGDAQLWFNMPNDEWRNSARWGTHGGDKHAEPGVVHTSDGSVTISLFYSEAEPSASVPYSLSARVSVDPTVIRAGFPVGITLPAATPQLHVELLGEKRTRGFDVDTPDLMVWGPDDAYLGRYPLASKDATMIDLPTNASAGEYVLLLTQGARSIRVSTATPEPATLRALPQEWVVSDARTATAQKAEWSFDSKRVPILAGLVFSPSTVGAGLTVKLESPDGVMFSGSIPTDPTSIFVNVNTPAGPVVGNNFEWDGGYGIPKLAAGTYHALVQFDQGQGADKMDARDLMVYWLRAAK